MNRFLSYFSITILFLFFVVFLSNLIGFGSQEVFLNHPGYPEGEDYLKDLKEAKVNLFIWFVLDISLLVTSLVSIVMKKELLSILTTLATSLLLFYLPLKMYFNGNIVGAITLGLFLVIISTMLFYRGISMWRNK